MSCHSEKGVMSNVQWLCKKELREDAPTNLFYRFGFKSMYSRYPIHQNSIRLT